MVTQEELWGGNRESIRNQLGSESLFLYAVRTHKSRREEFPSYLAQPEYDHLHLYRFRQPTQTEQWLQSLPNLAEVGTP
ncbi:MAG: hypothetical protein R3C44_01215 [Chloroflexota bacterium]